jgi:pyrroloquinoline quinone biosynthesis protein B
MPRLTAIVLGSAAGGGVPQWNCNCQICALARAGNGRVRPRTQMGLALSGDGRAWTLINASPDLRSQLNAHAALHPRDGLRASPIEAVVLTGAEIDQTAGLLTLRERQPFALLATAETLHTIDANPMFKALAGDLVRRTPVVLDAAFRLPGGIEAELFGVPGKLPLYLEEGAQPAGAGVNAGIELRAQGARVAVVPGAAAVTPALAQRLAGADLVMFDGTVFTDDEMIRTGTGAKTGRRMGHIPVNGADGSLAALAGVTGRRIFIHINNTNPILIEDSPERRQVEAAGWQVAHDGMELTL